MQINSFSRKIESLNNEADILRKELKAKFPEVFSECLIRCCKMSLNVNYEKMLLQSSKEKETSPLLRWVKSRMNQIDLRVWGVLSKVEYSKWASPVTHVKKKTKEIRVCADSRQKVTIIFFRAWTRFFQNLAVERFSQKSAWATHLCKYQWMKNVQNS